MPEASGSTNVGAIVGGVVGGVGGLLLLAGAVLLYRRRRRQSRSRPLDGPIDEDDKPGDDAYQAIVEDFVTPYTHTGSGTQPSAKTPATAVSQETSTPPLQVHTGVHEADAGPVAATLPPLYDPSWQSAPSTPVSAPAKQ